MWKNPPGISACVIGGRFHMPMHFMSLWGLGPLVRVEGLSGDLRLDAKISGSHVFEYLFRCLNVQSINEDLIHVIH